jgi:hypothetical protein
VTLEENRQLLEQTLGTLAGVIPELQVTGYFNTNPSPPSIDIYPADPSQEDGAFGLENGFALWTVRARVNVADDLAAQQVLIRLLEPATGVASALADANVSVREFSGYREYPDMVDGRVLGCEWRVQASLEA